MVHGQCSTSALFCCAMITIDCDKLLSICRLLSVTVRLNLSSKQRTQRMQDQASSSHNMRSSASSSRREEHKKIFTPTVKDIITDKLTLLGLEYWADEQKKPFEPKVVEDIYGDIFTKEQHYNLPSIMLLELSHYLE